MFYPFIVMPEPELTGWLGENQIRCQRTNNQNQVLRRPRSEIPRSRRPLKGCMKPPEYELNSGESFMIWRARETLDGRVPLAKTGEAERSTTWRCVLLTGRRDILCQWHSEHIYISLADIQPSLITVTRREYYGVLLHLLTHKGKEMAKSATYHLAVTSFLFLHTTLLLCFQRSFFPHIPYSRQWPVSSQVSSFSFISFG